jgi:D-amino-acid oxidase
MNRRQLLASFAAAGILPTRGWAQEAPLGRLSERTLPAPDFSAVSKDRPFIIGVRPHRLGGIRTDWQAPLNGKQVIHNYGHGGAGITLAWGTAVDAAEMVLQSGVILRSQASSVAILGTGVVGLTTATAVKQRWPDVPLTIYAKSHDLTTTTSWIAGGQFEPSGVWPEYTSDEGKGLLGHLLRVSRDQVLKWQKMGPRYGVLPRDNYILDRDWRTVDEFTPRDVIPAMERGLLPFENMRGPGRRYRTWLVNPTMLLPALKQDLIARGVAFVERTFETQQDVASLAETIVVNCTGYGAKTLFGDDKLYPVRGHLVMLDRTLDRQDYFFGGGCGNGAISYTFCRQNDIVLGGSVKGEDDREQLIKGDPEMFQRILRNGAHVFGGRPEECEKA